MMLPPARTDTAVLLCAVFDERQVLRFPLAVGPESSPWPGIVVTLAPVLPLNVQLMSAASKALGVDVSRHLTIVQEFADEMGGEPKTATLYLGSLAVSAGVVAPGTWPTMPDLLRRLTGRQRVPYMRAWQILAGGLQLNTKAVDSADVAKYLED